MSEQITWVSQIVGADYLGLQNAGAEYLGPFFAKSGADYLGGADYLSGGAEYLGIAKSGGQNTWARPKVGQITWDDFFFISPCFPSSPSSPAVLLPSLVGGEPRELMSGYPCKPKDGLQLHVVLRWATHRTSSRRSPSHQRLGHQPALFGVLLSCCVLLRRYIHSIFRCMSYRRHPASTVGISMPALDFRPLPLRRKRLGGRPAGCDTFLDFMAAAGEGSA